MKGKIRVLQVTGSLRIGGLEKLSLNYFKYIDRQLFEFDYLVYGSDVGELEAEVSALGANVLRVPSPRTNFIKFLHNVRRILSKHGPYQIVHSHPLFNSGLIMKAAYAEGVPMRIAHAHSARLQEEAGFLRKSYIWSMRYNLRNYATHYLACSKGAGRYLFGSKWFDNKGCIINNGIDARKYSFDRNVRAQIRAKFGLNNKFVVGHVGRLCETKNQTFLLNIFKMIKEVHPDSTLMLVGTGPLMYELKMKAKRLGICKDVLCLGVRRDVNVLLQGMDVFVFPSKHEGLGMALIEAQAAGLPCIISESIPKEVDITDLVERLSLSSDMNQWASKVLDYANGYERSDRLIDVLQAGYDIRSSVEKLACIYSSAPSRGRSREQYRNIDLSLLQ